MTMLSPFSTSPIARLAVACALASASLLAQNCPERTLGVALGSGDDVTFGMQSIGFAFPFAGATYTDIHVCTNGYVQLSNGGAPVPDAADFSATAAELASGSPRIAPLWTDLNMDVTTGGVCYINSTPSQCTITWDQAACYGIPTEFQIQLQLFTSGEIKFFYSTNTINASTYSTAAAQGLVGVSAGQGAILPATSNLSVTGVTTDDTLYETFLGGQFDMANTSLQLLPQTPGWVRLPAAWSLCAAASNYGTGCIQANDSFYQSMPATQFDMANRTLTMLRQTNGYIVLDALPGTFVPPSASAVQIVNGDDVEQTISLAGAMPVPNGTTSALTVCSNGFIALSATGNGTSTGPTIPVFLAWAQTVVGCIHDYDPTAPASGLITFEESGGFAYVTWNNVLSWNQAAADTFQFQFNEGSGDIKIVFGAFQPAGNNYLVGYSVGGPSPDPGTTDVSSAFAGAGVLITDVPTGPGLALAVSGLPVLGTSFQLDMTNAPNVAPLGFVFFGSAAVPGVDLGFLGAPGCRAYTTADLLALNVPLSLPGGFGSISLQLPTTPAFAGLTFTSQGVAFTLANPLNLVTSNGTSFAVGY